jgi:hypothetical protein
MVRPMTLRTPLVVGLAAVASAATVALPIAAHAAPAVTLYANPLGQGTVCTKVDPCDLGSAMLTATSGDTIMVAPGSYGSKPHPLTDSLQLAAHNVTIQDQNPTHKPVIYSTASVGILISAGSSFDGFTVNYTGTKAGLSVLGGATVRHATVVSSSQVACSALGTMTDSLCVDTLAGGTAVSVSQAGGTISPVLRGVTAEATATGGYGLFVTADSAGISGATITTTATNVIAHGSGGDILVTAGGDPSSTATLTVSHSAFSSASATGSPGTATVINGAGNVSAAPKFVDAATGNYREAPGSPTINAGAATPVGDTDLAGLPRWLGSAPDIGAYEFPVAPGVSKVTVTAVAAHSAGLSALVNPHGLATSIKVFASYRHTVVVSKPVSVGNGTTRAKVALKIAHLASGVAYNVRVVARNSAGTTTVKAGIVTTS